MSETKARAERFRALRIWRSLDPERRQKAATVFWKSDAVKEEDRAFAVAALSKTMRFRPQSILAAPLPKRASYLSGFAAMTDQLAASLLFAYHLETQVPLLSRFLDLLGVAHEKGRITGEAKPPDRASLDTAASTLLGEFDPRDVTIYFETLVSQDDETWAALAEFLEARAAAG